MTTRRTRDIWQLHQRLAPRDVAILTSVDQFRLLTTRHVQRLHFDAGHANAGAAARACTRALLRLRDLGLLRPLDRRIGGVRAGSAGFVWFIGPAGDRLLHYLQQLEMERPAPHGDNDRDVADLQRTDPPSQLRRSPRRNYQEPSRHFVDHALAVAELAVSAVEETRRPTGSAATTAADAYESIYEPVYELIALETEPACWQRALSPTGTVQWLKPDLRLVTATASDEYHWFIEADLATEHIPVIVRQCAAYQAYRATGLYESAYGLFPAVLWVVPTQARQAALRAGLAGAGLDSALFQVCTAAEFRSRVFPPFSVFPANPLQPGSGQQNGQGA